jgi:mycothiol synthase
VDRLIWRSRLDEGETAEVLELIDAVTEADGTGPVSEHVLLHLRHGGDVDAAHLLARSESGALAGYAHLDVTDKVAGGAAELAVHAAHRGRGVGTSMVQALLDKVSSANCPAAGRLRLWAHGGHPAAVALAARFGFRKTRVLWQMRRSLLAPLPKPELPEGVRLRPFRVGQDEQAFIEVNNRAFEWHPEQGGWDIEQLKLRQGEPWFDPEGFLLAVDESDRLLGFHWTKVHGHDGEHDPIGEVYVVGVDPSAQGQRLGGALTLAGLRYLRSKGLGQVMLYVEEDNEAAIRVYQRLGFTHWDTDLSYLR